MATTHEYDAIAVDALRQIGSVKWSTFPGKIGAFIAEMDFGTAPAITQALHEAVDIGAFGYLPDHLTERMSAAVADWYRTRYGWDVAPAHIRALPDVLTGLRAVIEHFTEAGSAVIVPTPAYMPFLPLPLGMGRRVIQLPMVRERGRDVYDLDALDAAFAEGAGLLVLCNPHNPIGRVLEHEEMVAISVVVDKHAGRVFSDEIHAPLVFEPHRHVPYASVSDVAAGHTVTAASASKAWNLPGMKTAQLILSAEKDRERWDRVGRQYEQAANLGVVAATAAFGEGGPWLQQVLGYLDRNRRLLGELLAEHLPGVGYTPPEGTYLAWLDARSLDLPHSPRDFFADRADVVGVDGALCGTAGTGFFRYNFATPTPIMERSIAAMGAAVAAAGATR